MRLIQSLIVVGALGLVSPERILAQGGAIQDGAPPSPQLVPGLDFMWSRSSDWKMIGYRDARKGLSILDLQTLQTYHAIDYLQLHDGETLTDMLHPFWAPQNPDEVIFKVISSVDTSDATPSFNGGGLYRYNFRTQHITCVTPEILGKFANIGWYGWKSNSERTIDSLHISISPSISPDGKHFYGYYVPQTKSLVRIPLESNRSRITSADGLHYYEQIQDSLTKQYLWPPLVNGIPLDFPSVDTNGIDVIDFSPNSKYVLFHVRITSDDTPPAQHREVWISTVDDPSNPFLKLNIQEAFGMEARAGMHPRALTDSSIALSMHYPNATISPIWEVSISGQVIRQLTSLDIADVDADPSSPSLLHVRVLDNPFSASTEIEYTLGKTMQVEVSLFNALGQVVWSKPFGAVEDARMHRLTIGQDLAPGSYFLRVATMTGELQTVKLIKQ